MSTGTDLSSEQWHDELAWRDDEIARLRQLIGRTAAHDPHQPIDVGLTARECEVLDLIAHGLSTRQIAETLYLGVNSIKTHTQSVFRKIGVTSRTQAAVWALSHREGPGLGPVISAGEGRATG